VPDAYVEALYADIKAKAIAMDIGAGEGLGTLGIGMAALQLEQGGDASAQAWNNLLRRSALDQAPAAFTPTVAARRGRGGQVHPAPSIRLDMPP
jgi:hypothetical protein